MTSNQSGFFHQSLINGTSRENHHLHHSNTNPKLKRIRTSFLNLLHLHRSANNIENKNIHQEQEKSLPRRPSIIISSDIARSPEKKTVAFATAFDDLDNEYDEDPLHCHLENDTDDETTSEQDIINIIPNKEIDDETMTDPNKNIEPYPFRSEIQLPSSSIDLTTTHRHLRKQIFDRFIHPHHTKKLHPIPTARYISPNNRSISTPEIMISSSLPATSTKLKTNDRRRSLKTVRTWFKSLSLRPFLPRIRKSLHNNNPSKPQIPRQSTGLRRFSELEY
ncbi:unnamed protein product [Rotaria sordida]|uniref:Uncharacterized protein n=1 Tax=Rotaria sordida TaxID=392033 RepID=A0A818VAT6_9BILA|nr:unnamed protein product [Rotaria sordida]CAF3709393.1 unnamed protein product [Rotaria sordida]